jgi:hypothetical protein
MDADCDGYSFNSIQNGPSLKNIEGVFDLPGAYNAVHSPGAFPNDGAFNRHLARAMAAAHGIETRVVGNGVHAGNAVAWQAATRQSTPIEMWGTMDQEQHGNNASMAFGHDACEGMVPPTAR